VNPFFSIFARLRVACGISEMPPHIDEIDLPDVNNQQYTLLPDKLWYLRWVHKKASKPVYDIAWGDATEVGTVMKSTRPKSGGRIQVFYHFYFVVACKILLST
jgi:hypothetical protein